MNFVGNLLLFKAMKEFRKSIKNWESYRHEFDVLLFGDTVYTQASCVQSIRLVWSSVPSAFEMNSRSYHWEWIAASCSSNYFITAVEYNRRSYCIVSNALLICYDGYDYLQQSAASTVSSKHLCLSNMSIRLNK